MERCTDTHHDVRTGTRRNGRRGGVGGGDTNINKYLSRFVLDNDVGRNDALRFVGQHVRPGWAVGAGGMNC